MRFVLIIALLALSSCASRQEIAVQPLTAEQREASAAAREKYAREQAAIAAEAAAAREAQDDAKCRSYGAKPGTKSYIDCRISLNQNREQQAAREQAAAAYEQAQADQRAEMEEARRRCRSRALMVAGAAMMSSTSPYAGVGVGDGLQQGADYAQASGC
jgi:hypothetical protein